MLVLVTTPFSRSMAKKKEITQLEEEEFQGGKKKKS